MDLDQDPAKLCIGGVRAVAGKVSKRPKRGTLRSPEPPATGEVERLGLRHHLDVASVTGHGSRHRPFLSCFSLSMPGGSGEFQAGLAPAERAATAVS